MRFLFTGLPYFGARLVNDLKQIDQVNEFIFCNTYYKKSDQVKFLFQLMRADKVVSFNGVSTYSGSLEWAMRLKKPIIMQWHGTDVLKLRENREKGRYEGKYIRSAKHFTDAVWLQEELRELGIDAEMNPFKYAQVTNSDKPFQSADVVTYIAQDKEEFYGYSSVYALAENNPTVLFHVIGSDGKNCHGLPNIIFHGWLDQVSVQDLLNKHAIFIRFTEHDGNALSVLEALANGNYVIWNHPHPAVLHAPSLQQLPLAFSDVHEQVTSVSLARNQSAINWVQENHKRDRILKNYILALLH